MANIQDLLEAAKGAIISGASGQAVTICENVLQRFPKHLEAHCLLAEAYREQGDLSSAEDFFLRCLSADPERLIARWALSILYDRRGERDAAIKHLSIALELSPDHSELRRELANISSGRLKPSTGGLGRLYLRGGLFERSADEFRRALQLEPQRLDLKLGLAEVLWRDGKVHEALQQCRAILDDSPDCLKALVIGTLIESDRASADALLATARTLDPDDVLLRDLARQSDAGVPGLRLVEAPVIVSDAESLAILKTLTEQDTAAEVSRSHDPMPVGEGPAPEISAPLTIGQPARATQPPEPRAPILEPRPTVVEPKAIGPEHEPSPTPSPTVDEAGPALDVADTASKDAPRAIGDVPEWLAGDVKAATDRKDADDLGEWAELLDEQITLDPEAEARLSAALLDVSPSEIANEPRAESPAPDGTAPPEEPGKPAGSGELDALLKAVEESPDSHDNRLALARGYAQAGHSNASIAEYRSLLAAAPQLGAQVADGLQALVRQEPGNPDAHRALGDAFMKIGRFQQAIDEYNQAVSLKG